MTVGQCRKHKSYKAKRKPSSTLKHPSGCERCWQVWHDTQAALAAQQEK